MAEAKNGSSEGIVAASAIHTISFNLPTALEDSNTDAKKRTNEEHKTMEICPPGEEKDAEEPQLNPIIVSDLALRPDFTSASIAESFLRTASATVRGTAIKSRIRLAGSIPTRSGS